MIIDAVIYGPTPSNMTDILDNPPPEKIFRRPISAFSSKKTLQLNHVHSRNRDIGCQTIDDKNSENKEDLIPQLLDAQDIRESLESWKSGEDPHPKAPRSGRLSDEIQQYFI
jgi:hypothetical protein